MADNNTILDYGEIENLDEAKLQEAKKKFQDTTYTLLRDTAPITGELQSYKYALQDAEALAKAARGEEGYDDMTPLEALGYVGLTGLGVAGMIPFVGPYAKKAAQGIRALMPRRGPRRGADANDIEEEIRNQFPRGPINARLREAILNDPRYQIFVDGLPAYRQNLNLPENFEEYRNIYMNNPERMQELNTLYSTRNSVKNTPLMTERSMKAIEDDFNAKKIKNSKALTVQAEPLSFGKSKRQLKVDNITEFMGSAAWDYVKKGGNEFAKPAQWMGFMKGSLNKGIKAEELEDAGLLIFNKKGEPVGGDLFELSKKYPNMRISKAEVLSVLETNPAYKTKVKNYSYPLNEAEILNVNKTFRLFNDDVQRMLSDKILDTPVNQRQPLKNLITSLDADAKNLTAIGQKFSASKTQLDQVVDTKQRLIDLLPTLKDNEKLIVRNLISDYDKYEALAKKGLTTTNMPKHKSVFAEGGYDYREKVIYLDEALPGNESAKKIYSSHFNDPNPIAHIRFNTRGIDNYGDTYYIGEIQSDTGQSISKRLARYEGDKPLVRNNPFKNKIINSTLKREINEKITEINKLTDIANERPLSPPEFSRLTNLQKEKKVLESNFQIRPSQVTGNEYYGQSFSPKEGTYDFYPMMKEATWTKLALKSLVKDARNNNVRYIAIGAADDYLLKQVGQKQKLEQYYGLSGDELVGSFRKVPGKDRIFKNLKGEGVGKYRDYKSGKLMSTAVVPKAMQEIAKELGAKVVVKRVMKSDVNKPFKIQDSDGKIVGSFSSKAERDSFLKTDKNNFFEGVDITDIDDPRNYNTNVVLDLAGSSTGRMKAYKLGGLVEVKREYFAPLFG
jgi:hypothetical protein